MNQIKIKLGRPKTLQEVRSHHNSMALKIIWRIRDQPDNKMLNVMLQSILYCKFKRIQEMKE